MILPDFLTRDADGEIRLPSHRIGLYTVVRCLQEGATPERVAEEYPSYPFQCVICHLLAACFFIRLASSSWAVETCGCFLL